MSKFFFYFSFLVLIKIDFCFNSCLEGQNSCLKCNPVTKLCVKCILDIYTPNENGGCRKANKCFLGNNYCLECSTEGDLCQTCEINYFPDENGGCSSTNNCEISYRGNCVKCKDNFILVGDDNSIKVCLSLNSENLKNCETINTINGSCEKCKNGYYLNSGDKRCITTPNCYESIFGDCQKCNNGYYLYKKENKCIKQNESFTQCKETVDGKICDICDEGYYFDEDGKCIGIKNCLKGGKNNICKKCNEGYFLSKNLQSCTQEKNCFYGYQNLGICSKCIENYYIDYKDGKCKSNQENNIFRYCDMADYDICKQCIYEFYLGQDNKCSTSRYCVESNEGKCLKCQDNYHLGNDNKCTNIEHCIFSNAYKDECLECEDNYYYDINNKKCNIAENIFDKCKIGNEYHCIKCKNDFFLNKTDYLCYSNKDYNNFYKCAIINSEKNYCEECIEGYYLGKKDNKCSTIVGCDLSENEKSCKECGEFYCLDIKTGKCVNNDIIYNEEKKFYYRCKKINKEGTACEICDEGLTLTKDGLCIDNIHCSENNIDGSCQKCEINGNNGSFCLNYIFGCIEMFYYDNCLECNDIFELEKCNKCSEGYVINEFGHCEEI